MRTKLGWAVTVLGALCCVLGLALAVVLGPDSRFRTGPHEVDTDGTVVVTAPKVISWKGLQVEVLAELPVNKPVFVGIGNSVDVQNYVGDVERLEVTSFSTPWKVKTREVSGKEGLPGAPTALDWWIADSAGLGGASVSTRLPDQTVSAAIVAVGATNLTGLKVSFAYGIEGGFAKGIALVLVGAGGIWGGRLMRTYDADEDDAEDTGDESVDDGEVVEVEEIVYVYVDEDGVEHEISEEEAAALEAAEQHDEAEADPEPEPEPEPAPERPIATTGVLTAADIVAGAVPEEAVTYVYVDEDGVEHEISPEELEHFEPADDDEEDQS
ncbi:hypothetical protein [Aeromicrobium terrae]|uniref:hypothetical protein n=1 Tax=Aeromicrobium terrae TaxID=2498846 RepID=UPI00164F0C5F|nr:hypothetical protein [Aeromicrobium terrae]